MKGSNQILNWFYPRHCPICHKILKDQSGLLCPACLDGLKPVGEPRCKKCGKPLEEEEREYCADCSHSHHAYEEGIGIFFYDKRMKESLMKFKYYGRREYGEFYGQAAAVYGRPYVKKWDIQGIIPIPLHRRKQRERGFNQAEYLADILGREWGIPVYSNCLKKVHNTKSQKKLGSRERKRNLQGAFQGVPGNWGIRRVLLVDDVYTTGSTMDAAAAEIRAHGVEKIFFLTIFVGKGF